MKSAVHARPDRRMRRGGFTLVELLVTIAIISLLMAILFPAFLRVKARANQTKCAANLSKIGMGFIMYAGDHNGRIGNYDTDNLRDWGGQRAMWGGIAANERSLAPYLPDVRVFQCPADIGGACGNDLKKPNYKWAGNSYDVSNSTTRGVTYLSESNIYRSGNSVPGTLAAIDKPGRVILAYDATFVQTPKKYWHPGDRSNVVMLDGHVESMPKEWGQGYPKNPDIYSFGWNGWYHGDTGLWDPSQNQ